jgi:hypothetical protein
VLTKHYPGLKPWAENLSPLLGEGDRFENVNVVHSYIVRLRSAGAELRRDAFALCIWVLLQLASRAAP